MKTHNPSRPFLSLLLRLALPPFLVILLFVADAWFAFLPTLETNYLARKREGLENQVATVIAALQHDEADARAGRLSPEAAKRNALRRIGALRYGRANKEYFWVLRNDGRMLMHPYRSDLIGRGLSDYSDAKVREAVRLMVDTCSAREQGFIHYQWQWKDDPHRSGEKISFVRRFPAWNWIIGTGIYLDDVRHDMAGHRRKMLVTFLTALGAVTSLTMLVSWFWQRANTRRLAAEAALAASEERIRARNAEQAKWLRQSDKLISLGTLVAGLAHEINNPNSAIAGDAHNLSEIWTQITPALDRWVEEQGAPQIGAMSWAEVRAELPEMIADIGEASSRIGMLIERLREFSQPTGTAVPETFDLNDAVRTALALAHKYTGTATQALEVNLHPEPLLLTGARNALEHLCLNLLLNATQALTDPRQAIRLCTDRDDEAAEAILRVRDEGRGIAANDLPRVYDPFFTTRRDSGGTGLGLSIVANIVAEQNGRIDLSSTPGQGTTFTVHLPWTTQAIDATTTASKDTSHA